MNTATAVDWGVIASLSEPHWCMVSSQHIPKVKLVDVGGKLMFNGFVSRVETGGYSGGDCWGADPSYYSTGIDPRNNQIKSLVSFIKLHHPDRVGDLYQKISKYITYLEETEYEYYGNSINWSVQLISTEDVLRLMHEYTS